MDTAVESTVAAQTDAVATAVAPVTAIMRRIAAIDEDVGDVLEVTLRVRYKDWPERLIRGNDVDFNTAVLEDGLRCKTDYERGMESAEGRIKDLEIRLRNAIDDVLRTWSTGDRGSLELAHVGFRWRDCRAEGVNVVFP
jgi:hypothetical protein